MPGRLAMVPLLAVSLVALASSGAAAPPRHVLFVLIDDLGPLPPPPPPLRPPLRAVAARCRCRAQKRCRSGAAGYADVSYHGKQVGSTVPTPHIDALALAGVRLEKYYVVQLCSPTRTSLLSGRYPYNIGMNGEVIVDGHPSCMPLSVSTIADRLSDAGWATSAYGKWSTPTPSPPTPPHPS